MRWGRLRVKVMFADRANKALADGIGSETIREHPSLPVTTKTIGALLTEIVRPENLRHL
jgi:hypothetical protein